MRLLLDEMFPAVVAQALRSRGYDVVAVQEEPRLRKARDPDLFGTAQQQCRALLTDNGPDFLRLLGRSRIGRHYGLICTTNKSHPRHGRFVGKLVRDLTALLDEHPGEEALSLVLWL